MTTASPSLVPLRTRSVRSLTGLITTAALFAGLTAFGPGDGLCPGRRLLAGEPTFTGVKAVASPLANKVGAFAAVSFDASDAGQAGVSVSGAAGWGGTNGAVAVAKGGNMVSVPLNGPVPEGGSEVKVAIRVGGNHAEFGPFKIDPPRNWTVYLVQHTHTDIGYTRPQTEILPEHLRYIDYALDYCDLTDGYPEESRFRWTCETSWAVREYLKVRPARQVERLKKRVTEGRIEVCGLMLNMSEIAGESALAALLAPLRTIRSEFGVNVTTAMQDDVNGAGWCLPDYFDSIGLRYLTMGINQTRSILPFDKPTVFWWESPSGKRVLAYRADHYMTANFWGIEKGDAAKMSPGLEKYLLSLEDRKYPFDRVGVQFSGYFTDNSPPSTAACDVVKSWNETHTWPKLRLATARDFLAWVEKEKSGSVEVHRQAWPDWWTDGFGSAARETAAARETESSLHVTQGLLSMAIAMGAKLRPETPARAAAIRDNLLFYHEHTYGAAESISDPLAENSEVQWGEKASYVWSAVKDANQLREEAFGQIQEFLPRADVPTLAVFNSLNWPRSGLVRVFIDHEILHPDRGHRILDGTEPLLAQPMERRAEGTYWAIWVPEVPAMGFKILRLESDAKAPAPENAASNGVQTLESRYYKLTLDPRRGAASSLIDKETGAELVDASASWALGQCVHETMPANREIKREVFQRDSVRNVQIEAGARGPVWKSLVVKADLDGAVTNRGLSVEYRLYETDKRVELHYNLKKLPVVAPEAIYVALPFSAPSSDWGMLYEAQGGNVVPGRDQIPGSSSDWQTLQSFLSVRGSGGQIVMGSDQAPLVQLGDFNLGKWMPVTRVEKPHVYSWVMNNYWFTNFRAEQEGEFKWYYYLTSVAQTNVAAAVRFGWGSRIPLAARVLPPVKTGASSEPRVLSTVEIRVPNILLVESRPLATGDGIVMQLREVEGRETTIMPSDVATYARARQATALNVLEEPLEANLRSLTFKPFEVKFIRATFTSN